MDDGEKTQWSCYRITLKAIKGHRKVNKRVYWLIVGNINWPHPLNMIGLKPARLHSNNLTSDCPVILNEHHCWHLSSFNEDICRLSGPIRVGRASPVGDWATPASVDVETDDGQQPLELDHGNLSVLELPKRSFDSTAAQMEPSQEQKSLMELSWNGHKEKICHSELN